MRRLFAILALLVITTAHARPYVYENGKRREMTEEEHTAWLATQPTAADRLKAIKLRRIASIEHRTDDIITGSYIQGGGRRLYLGNPADQVMWAVIIARPDILSYPYTLLSKDAEGITYGYQLTDEAHATTIGALVWAKLETIRAAERALIGQVKTATTIQDIPEDNR